MAVLEMLHRRGIASSANPLARTRGTAQRELGEQHECSDAMEVAHAYARYRRD